MGDVMRTIQFCGTKENIIDKLSNYMDKRDAERFYNKILCDDKYVKTVFNSDSRIKNYSIKKPYLLAAHRKITNSSIPNKYYNNKIEVSQKNENGFIRAITKVCFVSMVIALDITLKCTVGFSLAGDALLSLSSLLRFFDKGKEAAATCIVSIVRSKKYLPKFSLFKSGCINYNLNCNYRSSGICGLSKEKYEKIVNKLFEKKILLLME